MTPDKLDRLIAEWNAAAQRGSISLPSRRLVARLRVQCLYAARLGRLVPWLMLSDGSEWDRRVR